MSRYYEESIFWGRFVRYTCLACDLRSNWFSAPRMRKRLRSLSSVDEPVNLRKFWVGLHKPHCAARFR